MYRYRCFIASIFILLLKCAPVYSQDSIISRYIIDLKTVKTDTGKVILLTNIASKYFEYDINKVNMYALQAKAISERIHFNKGLGRSLVNIAGFNIRKANYDLAGDELISALQLIKDANDTAYLIRIYNSFGAIDVSLGQESAEFDNDKKALDLARKSHDKKNELMLLGNMCNSYVVSRDFKNALFYGSQALVLARLLKSEKDSAYLFDDIGLCYIGMAKYDTGRYYLLHSLAMDEKMGFTRQSIVCLSNIAESYFYQNDIEKSLYYYDIALGMAKNMKDGQFVPMIQLDIGEIYAQTKQYSKAISFFKQTIYGLKNSQNYYGLGRAYLFMSQAYSDIDDYKNAYKAEILYAAIKDSSNKTSDNADIAAIENKYEIKKKQDEIKLLKISQTLKDSQFARQRLLFYGLIAGGSLILSLIIIVFNRAGIKQKMRLLEHSAELEKKALQLQMNPHFIFNALGSISGFIASNDKSNALKYLAKFSRLIRYILESSGSATVPLGHEIENLENYLELEKMRFNNKFSYSIQVANEIEHTLNIPPMIIQPFLENAVIHGIKSMENYGFIRISFSKGDDKLICTVEDNGIGRKRASEMRTDARTRQSMGIDITQKRLNIINATKKSLTSIWFEDLADREENVSGTKVTIQFYPI